MSKRESRVHDSRLTKVAVGDEVVVAAAGGVEDTWLAVVVVG